MGVISPGSSCVCSAVLEPVWERSVLVQVVCVWQSFRAGMGVISPGSSCVCLAEF